MYHVRALGPYSRHRPSKTKPGEEYEYAVFADDGRLVFKAQGEFGLNLMHECARTLNRPRFERNAA